MKEFIWVIYIVITFVKSIKICKPNLGKPQNKKNLFLMAGYFTTKKYKKNPTALKPEGEGGKA